MTRIKLITIRVNGDLLREIPYVKKIYLSKKNTEKIKNLRCQETEARNLSPPVSKKKKH